MNTKSLTGTLIRSAAILATGGGVAQAQDFSISAGTIAGGAATLSGESHDLTGTTGQSLVGGSSGGVFDTSGGFWARPPAFPGCSPADLVEPLGSLNFFDVAAFITLYNTNDPSADFAAPFGTLNFFDVAGYIASYNAGCP